METRNGVDKLLSIFDLNIYKALNLTENISTRVIFRYDKETNRKEFKVLTRGISQEMCQSIESWLAGCTRRTTNTAGWRATSRILKRSLI